MSHTIVDWQHDYALEIEAHYTESRPTNANFVWTAIIWLKNCNDFDVLACLKCKCQFFSFSWITNNEFFSFTEENYVFVSKLHPTTFVTAVHLWMNHLPTDFLLHTLALSDFEKHTFCLKCLLPGIKQLSPSTICSQKKRSETSCLQYVALGKTLWHHVIWMLKGDRETSARLCTILYR